MTTPCPLQSLPSVRLRALEPEDLELLYKIENDTAMWEVTDDPMPYSRYALRRYIAEQPRSFFQSGEVRLVIEEASGCPAGLVDLVNYAATDARAEVCIALLRNKRRAGIGRAALLQLENYARDYLRLRLLYALVANGRNEACHKLFRAAGYVMEATLPKWHRRGTDYEDIDLYVRTL